MAEENLFRRRILEYQEYLNNLRSPWFATRYKGNIFQPSQISSDGGLVKNPEYIFEVRKQYPSNGARLHAVQHHAWGGYDVRNLDADINAADGNKSTDKELVNITFDVFVHVAHSVRTGGGGLRFKFTEVLLYSSIIPMRIWFFFKFKTFSTFLKINSVNLHSSGPCILGLTI